MSTSSSPPPVAATAKKPRNPVERAIVWGIIGVLLVLVGVEYVASRGYVNAMEAIQSKMKDSEENKGPAPTEADVVAAVGDKKPENIWDLKGKNTSISANRMDEYKWFTLHPLKERRLLVYYGAGQNPDVIALVSQEVESADEKYPPLKGEALDEAIITWEWTGSHSGASSAPEWYMKKRKAEKAAEKAGGKVDSKPAAKADSKEAAKAESKEADSKEADKDSDAK